MDPSKKQAVVHMAAIIKYMCPHLKTLEVMKMAKFHDKDLRHASSYQRATDRRVAQLTRNNKIAPVPVPAINIPVTAEMISTIKVSTSATSSSTLRLFLTRTRNSFPRTTYVFVKTNHPYRWVEIWHVNHCCFSVWAWLEGRFFNPKV